MWMDNNMYMDGINIYIQVYLNIINNSLKPQF